MNLQTQCELTGIASERMTLPCSRQLERSSRFPQDGDGPMGVASFVSLGPEFVQRAVEGHRVVGDDECRAVVQFKNVEFHPATRVPRVYVANVCCADRVRHGEILHDGRPPPQARALATR